MLHFILTWLATAISLIITSHIVPGFRIDNFTAALIGAAILGFVNAIVRPLLILFTLPLTILSLGLFLFVINAIAFWLVAALTPGFYIAGFFSALLGAIVLTIVSTVLYWFFGRISLS
ncbi:phage holin family protein [Phormidesmis priestleyi]